MQPRAKEPTSDERAGPRRPGAKLTPYRGAPSSDPRSVLNLHHGFQEMK